MILDCARCWRSVAKEEVEVDENGLDHDAHRTS